MEIGLTHTSQLTIANSNTAIALGSGNLPVLATPQMAALMENASMLAVAPHLAEGSTTVGSMIQTSHIRPTAVGHTVSATATLLSIEGRKLTFGVEARDDKGTIGEGTHVRYIVDCQKFLAKL